MTGGEFLEFGTQKLSKADVPSAHLDSLILLEDILSRERSWILAHPEAHLSAYQKNKLLAQIDRRSRHEPLAFIRGFTEFYGRRFRVNRHTLEPRPESETMIELLKEVVSGKRSQGLSGVQDAGEQRIDLYSTYSEGAAQPATPQSAKSASPSTGFAGRRAGAALRIADVGCGCGAIGITAALEIPKAKVDLYDIDSGCLAVSRHNLQLHEIKLELHKRDLLRRPVDLYDIILANLPYVPDSWKINTAAEMEPRLAIFGGPDGLSLYRRMFEQLESYTWQPKFVLTESLPPQHKELEQIAKKHGFKLLKSQDFIQIFTSV